MSVNEQIAEKINNYLSENDDFTKKEFVTFAGEVFDECNGKEKKATDDKPKKKPTKKADEKKKPAKKADDEDKPKKPLTKYQEFVKEQMPILKAREDAKEDGDEKKKASALMKEIGELWQEAKK